MTLRTRLLLGYGYLVLLLVVVAATATVGFFDLGGRIRTILEENVESLEATTRLMETLERQDSATLSAMLETPETREKLQESDAAFREALQAVDQNVTSETEREIVSRLEREYRAYHDARNALLDAGHDRPLASYEASVFPQFQSVKQDVRALLQHNQQAIARADRSAQHRATQYGVSLAVLVGVGLLSLLVMTRALQRRLLDRLDEIRDVAEAVAAGNLRRRVRVDSDDELGMAGKLLNRALDRYAELERNVEGQLGEMKQNLLALFDTFDIDGAFFNVDGRLVASTLDFHGDDLPEGAREAIVDAGRTLVRERDRDDPDVDAATELELSDGTNIVIELIYARGQRLAGWLAEVSR